MKICLHHHFSLYIVWQLSITATELKAGTKKKSETNRKSNDKDHRVGETCNPSAEMAQLLSMTVLLVPFDK